MSAELKIKLPVGIESFEEIRTEGFYYIDKTNLIRDLLEGWGKVNLFTRPRRFGKSLKGQEEEREIRVKNAVISERERTVCQDGEYVELTPKEFDLLVFLVKNPRRVFTRSHLLDEIWGYDFMGDTRTVDIHIQRLRKKLCMGEAIVTVFGVGYKYVPEE